MQLHQQRCSMAIFHGSVDQAGCPVLHVLNWSRCIFFRGSRYSNALPTSSLLVTNACMTCSVAAAVRYCLILEMLRWWNIADLHTAVTCDSIVISASNWTPKLQTLWVTLTKQSPTRNACSLIFFSCWAETITITSVFESINFKEFVFIHIRFLWRYIPWIVTNILHQLWRPFSYFEGLYPTHVCQAITSARIEISSSMIYHMKAEILLFPVALNF